MVRDDLVGGLNLALQKGEKLENAMMSFYRAGYSKEEIEEAAKMVQMQKALQPMNVIQAIPAKPIIPPKSPPKPIAPISQSSAPKTIASPSKPVDYVSQLKPIAPISQSSAPKPILPEIKPKTSVAPLKPILPDIKPLPKPIQTSEQPIQKISAYESAPRKSKAVLWLVLLLAFIAGAIIFLILFREDVINFFNGLFS